MELFIGNKNKFGIELNIISQDKKGAYLGFTKLWFGGRFLGTIEDRIYIQGYLIKELKRLLEAPFFEDVSFLYSDEKLDYFFTDGIGLQGKLDEFKFSFGTMSDPFSIRAYRKNNDLVIMWKLRAIGKDFGYSDLADYQSDIYEYEIPISDFKKYVLFAERLLAHSDLLM